MTQHYWLGLLRSRVTHSHMTTRQPNCTLTFPHYVIFYFSNTGQSHRISNFGVKHFVHKSIMRHSPGKVRASSGTILVLSCLVSAILELLYSEIQFFVHHPIPAKILGCSFCSDSVILGSANRRKRTLISLEIIFKEFQSL